MKRNNIIWNDINRTYIEISGKQATKITPIRTQNGFIFKVLEVMYLDNQKVWIGFYANRLGKAISNIKNSYFDFKDSKDVYNALGAIEYKINLLKRIRYSLENNYQEKDQKTR